MPGAVRQFLAAGFQQVGNHKPLFDGMVLPRVAGEVPADRSVASARYLFGAVLVDMLRPPGR